MEDNINKVKEDIQIIEDFILKHIKKDKIQKGDGKN
jgi:hypothetical protein